MTNVAVRYATQIIAEEKKCFFFVHFTAYEINSFPVKLKLISGSRLAYNSLRLIDLTYAKKICAIKITEQRLLRLSRKL